MPSEVKAKSMMDSLAYKETERIAASLRFYYYGNSAIANPSLLDTDSEMSVYTPDGEVLKQNNEVSRLMDNPEIDYDRVKCAILQLAQMKYDCCTYSDIPQKTELLKKQLSDKKQQNTIDIELLKKCAEYITVSHNATIGLELIISAHISSSLRSCGS